MAEVIRLTRADYIWSNIMRERDQAGVSLDRARLFTESWRESVGKPQPIRRGMAMKHVLENIPLFIDDQQLIMGSYSSHSMWGEWYPEYESKFLLNAADDEPALKAMAKDEKDMAEIREIAEFWKDISVEDQYERYFTDEEKAQLKKYNDPWLQPWYMNRARHGGYYAAGIDKVVEKGYRGVIAELDAELAKVRVEDSASLHKHDLLQGWKIALEGACAYGHRCAALAREEAEKCEDPNRKAELLKMAEVCDQVPENPARDFHEALQATYFAQIFIYLESRGDGVSPGRSDQYLYPCYLKSKEAGMTEDEAIDLINCFRIKFNTFRQLSSKTFFTGTSGEAQFHNITLGGEDMDGNTQVNELSYLFLKAALQLSTPHPTLSVRYCKSIPEDFMDLALQVIAKGGGYPAFFNDHSNIEELKRIGVTPEDAQNYTVGGCVALQVPGKTSPGYPVFFNMAKALELAIHDGYDPYRTKQQVGPHTGNLEDFKTYEDFVEAFKTQVTDALKLCTRLTTFQRTYREEYVSTAFTDTLLEGCIEKGKTCSSDGPTYHCSYINCIGGTNVVNSLAAIKRCVFEKKLVEPKRLREILIANFNTEDGEATRKILMSTPQYGNDDDYVDQIAVNFYAWFCSICGNYSVGFGQHFIPGAYSVGIHMGAGEFTGALPDGRLENGPLADGSMSPCQGTDVNGPTALINSALKVDQYDLNSSLLNMKFQANAMASREDRDKLSALIKTYFAGSGKHIQFNVVDKSTLLDAQVSPEKHRSLLVRVAGYSAFFVELMPNLQLDIINRTTSQL